MKLSQEFELKNKEGLHARPAMKLVELASSFDADITIRHKGKDVDSKSIMSILTLGASKGTILKVSIDGEDAEKAMTAIGKLFENKFDEE